MVKPGARLLGLLLLSAVLVTAALLSAQEAPGRWILGVWEGAHSAPWINSDAVRFEFTQDGAIIKWKMDRKSVLRGRSYYWEASGTVTKIDEASVELLGKFDSTDADGRAFRFTGSSTTYHLTRLENAMEGTWINPVNQAVPVTLKKTK